MGRLWLKIWRNTRYAWPELLVIVLLGMILSINLTMIQAYRTYHMTGWIATGLFLGWVFTRVRWKWWQIVLYFVLLAGILLIQWELGILPLKIPFHNFYAWSDFVRLRLFLLKEEGGGWLNEIWRMSIQSPELRRMIFAGISMACCAWLSWWIARKRNIIVAAAPAGVFLAIRLYQANENELMAAVYLIVVLMGSAYLAFRKSQVRWDKEKVDWPYLESLLPEWLMGAAVFALAVGLIGWAAPTLATPEGWQKIGDALRMPPEEGQATSLMAPTTTPGWADAYHRPVDGDGDDFSAPRVDIIGEPPSNSDNTLFLVGVSDPPPAPEQAGQDVKRHHYYWRMAIYSQYTGSGWTEAELGEDNPQGSYIAQPAGRYPLKQDFVMIAEHQKRLVSMNAPFEVENSSIDWLFTADGSVILEGEAQSYTVVSWAADVTKTDLRSAGTVYPEKIEIEYKKLPDDIPDRVVRLSHEVVDGANNPYDKAERIETYLRSQYSYQLETVSPEAGQDVVEYFLFEARQGFCSYFASTMVVMLRLEGVPARVVTGFTGGEYDAAKGMYRVPASAAHAWVEVYFPGYGWVEFEPTAGIEAIARAEGEPETGEDAPKYVSPRIKNLITAVIWVAGGLGFALLLRIVILILRLGGGRVKKGDPMAMLYWKTRDAMAAIGVPPDDTLTPDEYYASMEKYYPDEPKLMQTLSELTRLYNIVLFSPRKPEAREAKFVRGLVYRLFSSTYLRLWSGNVIKRIGKKE